MFQYVVVTVCIKAGIETSAWTRVSGHPSQIIPLTSTWPHLRCDVGLEEGEYK